MITQITDINNLVKVSGGMSTGSTSFTISRSTRISSGNVAGPNSALLTAFRARSAARRAASRDRVFSGTAPVNDNAERSTNVDSQFRSLTVTAS